MGKIYLRNALTSLSISVDSALSARFVTFLLTAFVWAKVCIDRCKRPSDGHCRNHIRCLWCGSRMSRRCV